MVPSRGTAETCMSHLNLWLSSITKIDDSEYTLKRLFSTRFYVRFVVLLHGGTGGHFCFLYLTWLYLQWTVWCGSAAIVGFSSHCSAEVPWPETSLSFCRGSRVEGSMSRVPCRGSRVTILYFFVCVKWKTNKKNLKKQMERGHLHPYYFYLLGRERGEQNTLLDSRFLNMSDCLRTFSALLTSHHLVKNVIKKFKKLI